jgi:hypothetical protein
LRCNRESACDYRRQQWNAEGANPIEDSQHVQHRSSILAVQIGHQRVRRSVQSSSPYSQQERWYGDAAKGMSVREPRHTRRHENRRGYQNDLVPNGINHRPSDERSQQNSNIEEKKHISLLRQVNLQSLAHLRQPKQSPENCHHDAKDKNPRGRASEQNPAPIGL